MGALAAFVEQGQFDFTSIFQEFACVLELCLIIVLIDRRSHLDFFGINGLLLFARVALSAFLFIDDFFVIDYFTNRRAGFRRNFDEIKLSFDGPAQCFRGLDDANLLIVLVDQSYFSASYLFI